MRFLSEKIVTFEEKEHVYFIEKEGSLWQGCNASWIITMFSEPFKEEIYFGLSYSFTNRLLYWKRIYQHFKLDARQHHMRTHMPPPKSGFTGPIWPAKYDKYVSQEDFRVFEKIWDGELVLLKQIHPLHVTYVNCSPTKNCIKNMMTGFSESGTLMHKEIEDFLNTRVLPVAPTRGFKLFYGFYEKNPTLFQNVRCEVRLCDPATGVCGSIDMLSRDEQGNIHVWDWKKSNRFLANGDGVEVKDVKPFTKHFEHVLATGKNKYTLAQNIYGYLVSLEGYNVASLNLGVVNEELDLFIPIPLPIIFNTQEFANMVEEVKGIFYSNV
jgi:hypothetical protein